MDEQAARFLEEVRAASEAGHYQHTAKLLDQQLKGQLEKCEDLQLQIKLYYEYAKVLRFVGRYEDSEAQFDNALRLCEQTGSIPSEDHCKILSEQGLLYQELFRFDQSKQAHDLALTNIRQLVEEPNQLHAELLSNRGSFALNFGYDMECITYNQQAASILEKLKLTDTRIYADTHEHIAIASVRVEGEEYSRSHHKRAMEIRSAILRPDHPDLGYCWLNSALELEGESNEEIVNKTLQVFSSAYSDDSPRCISPLLRLGSLYLERDETKRALECFERALLVARRLGNDNSQIGFCATWLHKLFQKTDKDKARQFSDMATRCFRNALRQGSRSQNIVIDLSVHLNFANNYAELDELMDTAHGWAIEEFGIKSLKAAIIAEAIVVYNQDRNAPKAKEHIQQVIDTWESLPDNEEKMVTLKHCLYEMHRPGDVAATKTFADSLERRDPTQSPYFLARHTVGLPCPRYINDDDTSTLYNTVSNACLHIFAYAFLEALRHGSSIVECEHLLIGFMHGTDVGNIANRLLRNCCLGQNGEELNIFEMARNCLKSVSSDKNVRNSKKPVATTDYRLPVAGQLSSVIIFAKSYSKVHGEKSLQSRHLLLALLEADNSVIDTILSALSIDKEQLIAELRNNYEQDGERLIVGECNPYDDIAMALVAQIAASKSARGEGWGFIPLAFDLQRKSAISELGAGGSIYYASGQARKAGSPRIECEHLLMSLAMYYNRAFDVLVGVHPGDLSAFMFDFKKAEQFLKSSKKANSKQTRTDTNNLLPTSEDVSFVFLKATSLAFLEGNQTAGTKHVLAALLMLNRRRVNQVLTVLRISKHDILEALPACPSSERDKAGTWLHGIASFVSDFAGFKLFPGPADQYKKYRTALPNDENDYNDTDILSRPWCSSVHESDGELNSTDYGTTAKGDDTARSRHQQNANYDPSPNANKGFSFKRLASLAVLGAIFLKGKTVALIGGKLLSLAKLGWLVSKTWTIMLSFALYCSIWGWRFAAALIVLLYIHELGHFIFMWIKGLKPSAPVFIPFLGAYVAMNELPQDKMTHALVAYAGPFVGGLGALLFLFIGQATNNQFLIAGALYGFMLNLLQLMPTKPFDGGFIVEGVSKWTLVPGVLLAFGAAYLLQSVFMLVLAVIGLFRMFHAFRGNSLSTVKDTTPSQKIILGVMYLGLALGLAVMINVSSSALPTKIERLSFTEQRNDISTTLHR